MEPADAELVREKLDPARVTPEEEWLEIEGESPAEAARLEREERQAECSRLRQVIEESRRLQIALERYLEALEA
jgi:hypothetical protein